MPKEPKETKPPKELSGITHDLEREWLRVELTAEEKMSAAKKIATSVLKSKSLEEQLDGIKNKFKADLKSEELKIQKNSELVEDGYEYRTVDSRWEIDWGKGTKKQVRLDTNEEIKTNIKIETSERQSQMEVVK